MSIWDKNKSKVIVYVFVLFVIFREIKTEFLSWRQSILVMYFSLKHITDNSVIHPTLFSYRSQFPIGILMKDVPKYPPSETRGNYKLDKNQTSYNVILLLYEWSFRTLTLLYYQQENYFIYIKTEQIIFFLTINQ